MRWLERLRAAEKTSHTQESELTKLPKGGSVSFVSDQSQGSEVFQASIGIERDQRAGQAPRWLERVRRGEKTSYTSETELPKLPKAPSGSFGSAQSQGPEVFAAAEGPDGDGPPNGRATLDLSAIDVERFNERAGVLEHDAGLTRTEAERQAAAEQGFTALDELYGAAVGGWAERLRALHASEQSRRGQECITRALAFIEGNWALEALRCGWDELALVGACPVAPWERLDRLGVAYREGTVVAVTASAVLYHSSGKEPLRLLRGSQADGTVLPWERPARDEPPPFKLPDRLEGLPEQELYALARGARFVCELERVWKEIDRRRALGQRAAP
jgi:hypothetical protein